MIERGQDDALLRALQRALHARQDIPPQFVAAGRSAFAWRDIDVELARLSFDSPGRPDQAGRPPAETHPWTPSASGRPG